MLVPANAVSKVLGKGGTNIANIRKVGTHVLILTNIHNFLQMLLLFTGVNFQKQLTVISGKKYKYENKTNKLYKNSLN